MLGRDGTVRVEAGWKGQRGPVTGIRQDVACTVLQRYVLSVEWSDQRLVEE